MAKSKFFTINVHQYIYETYVDEITMREKLIKDDKVKSYTVTFKMKNGDKFSIIHNEDISNDEKVPLKLVEKVAKHLQEYVNNKIDPNIKIPTSPFNLRVDGPTEAIKQYGKYANHKYSSIDSDLTMIDIPKEEMQRGEKLYLDFLQTTHYIRGPKLRKLKGEDVEMVKIKYPQFHELKNSERDALATFMVTKLSNEEAIELYSWIMDIYYALSTPTEENTIAEEFLAKSCFQKIRVEVFSAL